MRALLVVGLVACGGGSTTRPTQSGPPPQASPGITDTVTFEEEHTCADAAASMEAATVAIRRPGESLLSPMTARCAEDVWPVAAISCFAKMKPEDLGTCARHLPRAARDAMFAVLGGLQADGTSVAIVAARLASLRVGVPSCDEFVTAVAELMSCDRMPLETRVQLGAETADFWSLPTSGLSAEMQTRMGTACDESLVALARERTSAGCSR